MKTIFGILIILISLTSCCGDKTEYKYKITYIDGTTETIIRNYSISFIGKSDCVGLCECNNDNDRLCGVRKIDLIYKRKIKSKKSNETNDFL